MLVLFVIGIVYVNKLGNNSFIRANTLIMPIVLISIILIFIFNLQNFTLERMFPVFGKGIPTTFFSGISNLFAFAGIAFLYFLPPSLTQPNQYRTVAFTSVILSGIWLLFSVATLLYIFPSVVTTDESLPLYFASRYIEFGRFFQRLDAIFLLIWIISITSYLSIMMSFSIHIFRKITEFKYVYIIIYGFAIALLVLSLLPQNMSQIYFLEYPVYKYYSLFIVFIVGFTILILANLKHRKLKKGDAIIE